MTQEKLAITYATEKITATFPPGSGPSFSHSIPRIIDCEYCICNFDSNSYKKMNYIYVYVYIYIYIYILYIRKVKKKGDISLVLKLMPQLVSRVVCLASLD